MLRLLIEDVTEHKNGTITYSHTVVTPVIVAPGNPRMIPLEPQFVTPQDGHQKQDCGNTAAKRWLAEYGARYPALGVTILGDDLYCKQPLCEAFIREGLNFIHESGYEQPEHIHHDGDAEVEQPDSAWIDLIFSNTGPKL